MRHTARDARNTQQFCLKLSWHTPASALPEESTGADFPSTVTAGLKQSPVPVWPKNSCGPPVVILEKTAESLLASDRWSIRCRQLVSPRK